MCDGGALDWEYKKKSDILSNLDVSTVTTRKLEELEMERMKFNAFQVQLLQYMEDISFITYACINKQIEFYYPFPR